MIKMYSKYKVVRVNFEFMSTKYSGEIAWENILLLGY